MKIDPTEPLHATLARLGVAMPPDYLAYTAMQLVPECLGAAVLDTAGDEPTLLAMHTLNDHPEELKAQLGKTFGEMIGGGEVRRLLAMWEDMGRGQQIDELGFTTGPIVHDMARLASNPDVVLVVVTHESTNIRTTALNLGRVAESAVLGER